MEQLRAAWHGTPRDDACDDAALVVSELVTNAVRAGSHEVGVAIQLYEEHVRVEVRDDAPGMPHVEPDDPFSDHGRGLLIVGRLAHAWGIEPAPAGKRVWVDLAFA